MSKSTSTCYVDNCCFYFNLKTGCFILGYVGLIWILIAMLMVGLGMTTVSTLGEKDEKLRDIVPIFVALTYVLFVFYILALVFNVVLLIGLHEEKPGLVKVYLVYSTVFLIVVAILLVANILIGRIDASTVIGRIVQMFITIYFLVVIRSHYLNMIEPSNQTV